MASAVFDRIAIIGVGLIGGSIARAAKEKGAASAVSIFDGDPGALKRAGELGLGDVCASAEEAVARCRRGVPLRARRRDGCCGQGDRRLR